MTIAAATASTHQLALEAPVHDGELHRAREHGRLRPRRMGEHVDRGAREEHDDRPQQHAEPEREAGPEVGAPAPPLVHLGADDRLGEQEQAEQEEAGAERPVDELSSRRHRRR